MKSNRPLHSCTACKGTGKQELSDPLFRALQNVPNSGTRDVEKIATRLNITEQAANARMVALVKHGFIQRTRVGKKFVYSRMS